MRVCIVVNGAKISNKNTSDFFTLCPCLNLWCFLRIFDRLRAIPASFSFAVVRYIGQKCYENTIHLDKDTR